MVGVFYNKTTLKDTLIINISDNEITKVDKNDNFTIGFDKDNNLCFINIFYVSKYIELQEGFLLFDNKISDFVKSITNIDLSSHINSNDFIIAQVKECEAIKGTHLHKCKVFTGSDTLDVVCGAKNVRTGLLVVLAQVGAILPNGTRIKKGKLLNYPSYGMLCSKKELMIKKPDFNDEGIIELNSGYVIGDKFTSLY